MPPFAQHQNFLDPLLTSDGAPYGPVRYKEIVKERYYVSKYCNTSYGDVGKITPTERQYLLEFITNELEQQKKMLEEQKKKAKK